MADTYEKDLAQKSSLTVNDFIRVVGTDNVSYKQLVSDVAKKIIENYTGSSLAGSSQSVKAALDSLNSNTQSSLSSTSGTFDSWSSVKKNGNICSLSFRMTMTSAISAWSAIFTLPSGYRPSTDINLYLPVFLNGAISYMQVQILSNGNVRLATGINNGTTFGFTAIFW